MNYNPINVVFHDDSKELIRNLWHKYYIYYNADPTYELDSNSYTAYDKYSNRVQQQWGLQRGNKRFFKSIRIYSMQNHKFAEYTLINPMITGFNHDNHAYGNSGLMQNTMQFTYETVKYATGYVNDITPNGFGDIHYDTEQSDISDHLDDNTAFIDGSLQNVAGQRSRDLFQGNIIGVIKDAEIVYNETNLNRENGILTDTISIFANNLLTGKKPTANILVPISGKIEQTANNIANNNTTFDQVVKDVADYFGIKTSQSGNSIGQVPNTNVVTSQGKIIQTSNNNPTPDAVQYPVGSASVTKRNDGTVSHPSVISDVTRVNKSTTSSNTKPVNFGGNDQI